LVTGSGFWMYLYFTLFIFYFFSFSLSLSLSLSLFLYLDNCEIKTFFLVINKYWAIERNLSFSWLLTAYHLRLSNLGVLYFSNAFQFFFPRAWLKTTSLSPTSSFAARSINRRSNDKRDRSRTRCDGRLSLALCQKRKFRGHGAPQKFSWRVSCRNVRNFLHTFGCR